MKNKKIQLLFLFIIAIIIMLYNTDFVLGREICADACGYTDDCGACSNCPNPGAGDACTKGCCKKECCGGPRSTAEATPRDGAAGWGYYSTQCSCDFGGESGGTTTTAKTPTTTTKSSNATSIRIWAYCDGPICDSSTTIFDNTCTKANACSVELLKSTDTDNDGDPVCKEYEGDYYIDATSECEEGGTTEATAGTGCVSVPCKVFNINWDERAEDCSCAGYTWLSNAEYCGSIGCVEGQCCGDDGTDDTFCNGDIGDSIGACSEGTYYTEPDQDEEVCKCIVGLNNWDLKGETINSTKCCSDDLNEYNTSFVCQTNETLCQSLSGQDCAASCVSDSSDSNYACCDHSNDCVRDDQCYAESFYNSSFNPSSNYTLNGENHICVNAMWTDPDYGEAYCEALLGDQINSLSSNLDQNTIFWAKNGETSAFGEYNQSKAIKECCGDDFGEYYIHQKGNIINTSDSACCDTSTDCVWNNTCYANSRPFDDPYNINGKMRRCYSGNWSISLELKYRWDELPGDENCYESGTCGYCTNNSHCFIQKLSGQPAECNESGNYLLDHFCEQGNWTSRTKLVALQLLDLADRRSSNNFTLFCDYYSNSLNYLDYDVSSTVAESTAWNFLEGFRGFDIHECDDGGAYTIEQDACVNKVCVLKYYTNNKKKIAIGTSLNQPVQDLESNQFPLLYLLPEIHDCKNAIESDQEGIYGSYSNCGSTKGWYNPTTNSIIYSNEAISLIEPNFWERFIEFLKDPFGLIFDMIINSITPPTPHYDPAPDAWNFLEETKDFSRIFLLDDGSKSIRGIVETNMSQISGKNSFMTVAYFGFDADICSSIEVYDSNLKSGLWGDDRETISCYGSSRSYYVQFIPTRPEGRNLGFRTWLDLTAKVRTHNLE